LNIWENGTDDYQ